MLGYQDYYGRPIAVPGMSRQIAIPKSEMIAPAAFYRQERSMRGLGAWQDWLISADMPTEPRDRWARDAVTKALLVGGGVALAVGIGLGFWLGKRKK